MEERDDVQAAGAPTTGATTVLAARDTAQAPATAASVTGTAAVAPHVLVCSASADWRQDLCTRLSDALPGARVTGAPVHQCPAAARTSSPDLCIVALQPGEETAEAALVELLRDDCRPPVLVVAMQPDAAQGRRLLQAGAEDYRGDAELRGDPLALAIVLLTSRHEAARARAAATEGGTSAGEARLRLALEASKTGIWDWDPASGIVSWSPEAYTVHGISPDAFDGSVEMFWSLVHPDDLPRVQQAVTRAYEAREVYTAEFRICRPDGSIRHISNFGRVIEAADGTCRMVGTISDVTERTLAAERLRDSEERFRLMADQTPIILWVTDPQGGNEFVNRAYCEFFGVSVEDVYAGRWRGLVHPEDGAYLDAVSDALRARAGFTAEARVRTASGTWRSILSTAAPRRSASGEFLGLIGASSDVTDLKRAAALEQQAARQKDAFIAVLAHELRNPLAPIRTAVGVLSSREINDPVVSRCHGIIERQATQMARLLDDLLDASRLSRGTLTLTRRLVTHGEVIDRAIETSRPALDAQRQDLAVSAHRDAWLLADPDRLTQVFSNLLNNAAKYSSPGTTISVDVQQDDAWIHTRVRDTGIGMTSEMLSRVFDLFVQADDAQRHAPGGLGIGLSLARMLVELHGGTLTAASDGVGCGSTFTVSLPRTTAPAASLELGITASPDVRRALDGRRVLVVDDNMDAAEMIAALLAQTGCTVQAVRSGADALETSLRFAPEVVLLDLGMPHMDGFETCARLRAAAPGPLVVVALTGWGQPEYRERTLQAGFDFHLVKPIAPAELVERLRLVFAARPRP